MRNKWYSDNRDLVKWSALLLIARKHLSERIFQIAYFRPSHYGKFEMDGREYEIPSEIYEHFRDIRNITKLTSQPEIIVFDEEFKDRSTYLNAIKTLIRQNTNKQRCIVFIDPDTGLEPNGKSNHNHVLETELETIWNVMPFQWILAFYQHKTNRKNEEWVEPKRKQFSKAIGVSVNNVEVAYAFDIANDVVFFFAVKR